MTKLDELYAELERREQEYSTLARILAMVKDQRDKVYEEILDQEVPRQKQERRELVGRLNGGHTHGEDQARTEQQVLSERMALVLEQSQANKDRLEQALANSRNKEDK